MREVVVGRVFHDADETGVFTSQRFKDLQTLAQVFVFELFLEELFSEVLVDVGLVLQFGLHNRIVTELVLGVTYSRPVHGLLAEVRTFALLVKGRL